MVAVHGGKRNRCVNFGGNLDHHADSLIRNTAIIQQIMSGL